MEYLLKSSSKIIKIVSFRSCFASRFSIQELNKVVTQTRCLTIIFFKISFFQYLSSIDIWFTGVQCERYVVFLGNHNFFFFFHRNFFYWAGFVPTTSRLLSSNLLQTSNHWAIAIQVEAFEYLLQSSNDIQYLLN